MVSAGCAIGIGNVWRFPTVTGQYGGGVFVLFYLLFLVLMGAPVLTMELAVGRAGHGSAGTAYRALEPKGSKWHLHGWACLIGCCVLMMYYTTVSGWMLYFLYKMAVGDLSGLDAQGIKGVFGALLQDPATMAGNMAIIIMLCFGVCYMGVRNGVERITKVMMAFLIVLMVVLAANSMLLPGSEAGLKYYLYPDFDKIAEHGVREVIFAAMGQAFFTLSIGMGSLSIFGSYIGKEQKLTNEALWIMFLDTFVAIVAGLIIFPACFSFGIQPDAGPNLLFITLPNVFNAMNGGRIWGTLFFLFMLFAAMSTVIAVFEMIISSICELTGGDRRRLIPFAVIGMILLSLPCVFGFNIWSGFEPLGKGTCVLDLEDFLVSNNILPLGSLIFLAFCTSRYGWGWKNFKEEANEGGGLKVKDNIRFYVSYILPIIVLIIFALGIKDKFF